MGYTGEVRILHFAVPHHTGPVYRVRIENRYKNIDVRWLGENNDVRQR
jgi:hypothetical protein